MTTPPHTVPLSHVPAPVDPDRILAVCQVMGWPDWRGEQHRSAATLMPASPQYELAEQIVRAVDEAGPPAGHVLEVTDAAATITHPPACWVTDPVDRVSALYCLLADLVDEQVPLGDLPAGRYPVTVGDLGDRVLIGDRVTAPPTCRCEDPEGRRWDHPSGTGLVCGPGPVADR